MWNNFNGIEQSSVATLHIILWDEREMVRFIRLWTSSSCQHLSHRSRMTELCYQSWLVLKDTGVKSPNSQGYVQKIWGTWAERTWMPNRRARGAWEMTSQIDWLSKNILEMWRINLAKRSYISRVNKGLFPWPSLQGEFAGETWHQRHNQTRQRKGLSPTFPSHSTGIHRICAVQRYWMKGYTKILMFNQIF